MNCLVTQFRAKGNLVLVVGTTGLSIVYYERGCTAHSAFGIPVKEGNFDFSCTIHLNSDRAKLICAAKFIVWEELPMANKAAFEAVDSLLRSFTASPLPFGRKILMAVGDFCQVAPVVKGRGLSAAIDASVRTSRLWPAFQIHCLTQPMRNAQDPEFCEYADSIGEDTEGSRDITLQHLPRIYDQQDSLSWLYPNEILLRLDLCIKRSFLAVLNERVDKINDLMLDRLPGEESKSMLLPSF